MKLKLKIIILSTLTTLGCATIIMIYNLSENITHYHNNFTRRYPQHTAQEIYSNDLKFNSYYFAGQSNGAIYLGNYTAPLQVMALDTTLQTKKVFHIVLNQQQLPIQSPQIRVLGTDFYVFEGTVPYIFKGSTKDWKAKLRLNGGRFFSQLEPIDSVNLAIRYMQPKTGQNSMGKINLADTIQVKYNTSLLQKQFDGIFDTDGNLMVNSYGNKIIYVYLYRNQFIVAKPNLDLLYRGNTIDTITKAQIQLIQLKDGRGKTFAKPPLIVNKTSAVNNELLYINSTLPGQFETEELWKTASIIDVYNLTDKTYRSSFPIYNIGNKKMRSMLVSGKLLYALIGDKIVCYKLREHLAQTRSAKEYSKAKEK